jgi:hypothetical protein
MDDPGKKARVFVSSTFLQAGLICVGMAQRFTLIVSGQSIDTKKLLATNTLAYLSVMSVTKKKERFLTLTLGASVI